MPENVTFLQKNQKIFGHFKKLLYLCTRFWKKASKHDVIIVRGSWAEIESVAQQVEHIPFKDGVLGSSPSWFTRREFRLSFFCFLSSLIPFQLSSINYQLSILLAKLLQKFHICKRSGVFFAKNRIYSIILCTEMALDACIRKTSRVIK